MRHSTDSGRRWGCNGTAGGSHAGKHLVSLAAAVQVWWWCEWRERERGREREREGSRERGGSRERERSRSRERLTHTHAHKHAHTHTLSRSLSRSRSRSRSRSHCFPCDLLSPLQSVGGYFVCPAAAQAHCRQIRRATLAAPTARPRAGRRAAAQIAAIKGNSRSSSSNSNNSSSKSKSGSGSNIVIIVESRASAVWRPCTAGSTQPHIHHPRSCGRKV